VNKHGDNTNIIDLDPPALARFIHDPQTPDEERVALWLETKATEEDLDTIGHEVCNYEWEVWQALTAAVVRVAKRMMEDN
jgi:hypothetical protein